MCVCSDTYWLQIKPDTACRGTDTSRCNSRPSGSCTAVRPETQTPEFTVEEAGFIPQSAASPDLDEDVALTDGGGAVAVLGQVALVLTAAAHCSTWQELNTGTRVTPLSEPVLSQNLLFGFTRQL